MRIVLDQVQRDGDRHVVYVQLHDDAGVVIATESVPYAGDEAVFRADVARKLADAVEKEMERKRVERKIQDILAVMDVEKEVIKEK